MSQRQTIHETIVGVDTGDGRPLVTFALRSTHSSYIDARFLAADYTGPAFSTLAGPARLVIDSAGEIVSATLLRQEM